MFKKSSRFVLEAHSCLTILAAAGLEGGRPAGDHANVLEYDRYQN